MKIKYAIAGAVAAGAASLALAPIAGADPSDLVRDARAHGFGGTTDAGIESNGYRVCADLSNGYSADAAVNDIWLYTAMVERASAAQFVVLAVMDVCPQFQHETIHGPINGAPQTGGADI